MTQSEPISFGTVFLVIVLIYIILYVGIDIVTGKDSVSEYSLFGRVLFFPVLILHWLMRRLF